MTNVYAQLAALLPSTSSALDERQLAALHDEMILVAQPEGRELSTVRYNENPELGPAWYVLEGEVWHELRAQVAFYWPRLRHLALTATTRLVAEGRISEGAAAAKTVTRRKARPGKPCRLQVGDLALLTDRSPRVGAREWAGLAVVRIVSVTRQFLTPDVLTPVELHAEGLGELSRERAFKLFAELGLDPERGALCDRIEWEGVPFSCQRTMETAA